MSDDDRDRDGIEAVRQTAEEIEDIAPDPAVGAPSRTPDKASPQSSDDPLDPFQNVDLGARFSLNDTGNAQRLVLYFGDDAMFVPRVGWHIYDGRRWKLDPDENLTRAKAQLVQKYIIAEIRHLELEEWIVQEIDKEEGLRVRKAALDAITEEDRTPQQDIDREELVQQLAFIRVCKDRKSKMKSEHRSFAKTSGNSGRIDAMMKEAAVHLARDVEDLDSDPLTINTETGLLRFTVSGGGDAGFSRTADLSIEDHAREVNVTGKNEPQYITKMMPVEFDPEARCPKFDAFMERVQPDKEMRGFLQRWFGLALTKVEYQGFAFLYGDGANGKSVLVELMAKMAGDYAAKAKIESLTGHNRRGGGDATPDLMGLIGARFAHASEPEEGQRLQEATIKELTGGEKMLVRNLHSDFIEVKPYFKLTISGNYKPEIRGTDDGKRRYRAEAWRNWYGLKVWKDLCRAVDIRDGMQCQKTGVMLTHIANLPHSAIHDHKIPHRGQWDLFIDPNNVQLVSKQWHDKEKQKLERSMPSGVDAEQMGGWVKS